jgi:DNA-binding CsgD family transcriptional regulator
VTFPIPQPTSLYRGPFAEAWGVARTGRLRRAAAILAAMDTEAFGFGDQVQHTALLLGCRLGLGDLAAAIDSGATLSTFLSAAGGASTLARLGHGDLSTALGEHEEALDHYLAAGASPAAEDPDLPPWRAGASMALVRTGDRAEAARLAREQLALAEQAADPYSLALALRTLATTDAGVDPVRTLRRAVGLALHSNDLRLQAQIHADLAGLLLLSPGEDPTETLALLREAETFSANEGLWPLHARVSRLLGRAGERARPLGNDSLSILTNAERRVAQLASEGLTNRQIAEQLSVTIKGVEWHLSRVYRKLGIGSRGGLGPLLENAPKPRTA